MLRNHLIGRRHKSISPPASPPEEEEELGIPSSHLPDVLSHHVIQEVNIGETELGQQEGRKEGRDEKVRWSVFIQVTTTIVLNRIQIITNYKTTELFMIEYQAYTHSFTSVSSFHHCVQFPSDPSLFLWQELLSFFF